MKKLYTNWKKKIFSFFFRNPKSKTNLALTNLNSNETYFLEKHGHNLSFNYYFLMFDMLNKATSNCQKKIECHLLEIELKMFCLGNSSWHVYV